MDSYIQLLCRFQKSKQNVPPPSLPWTKKSPFTLPKGNFFSLLQVKCLLVESLVLNLQIWNFECSSLSFLNPDKQAFFSVNILVRNQNKCRFCWFHRNCRAGAAGPPKYSPLIILNTYQFYSNIFWVARNLILSNFIHFGPIWSKKVKINGHFYPFL